jgi:hypothetical protein
MTGTGTPGTINGEQFMTFDGSTLKVRGNINLNGGSYALYHDLGFLASSVTGYGDILKIGTGTLTAGNVYYLNSSQVWTATKADAEATSTGLLAIALGTDPVASGMLIRGYVRNSAWTQATGDTLYLSSATNGAITNTQPTATGSIVRVVGYMLSGTDDQIYFNPSNEWFEN